MAIHDDSRFTCDSECGLHSATRSEYRNHLRHQHGLQHPFTCKCVAINVTVARKVATILGSTAFVKEDGTLKCTDGDCDYATTCARHMELHKELRHHDAYRPALRCSSCETWFSEPCSLKRHNAVKHQGERRFKCDNCGYVTNIKSNLTRHQTSCQLGKAEKQLQLIDEAFKQLVACCVTPTTTGLTVAAVQKVSAVKKASFESFEALVAECLK
ncbi:hypothetical protein AAVH_31426 [Aphelenchoides avenae]|nr:hypothetical protein AAVH_31426 [Aphelenchus avenae]